MKLFTPLLTIPTLLFIASCNMESQRPSQIFNDGLFPELLEKLVRPPLPSSFTATYQDKNKENGNLDVAVIDEGVDYLHPKLMPRIHFTQDPITSEITGAGWNFLGENSWGGTTLINSFPFSFGAEGITPDGKIIAPLSDPLKTLDGLNTLFIHKLQLAIKMAPELQGTLFAQKIDIHAISLMGARIMVEIRDPWKKGNYQYNDYMKWKKEGLLVTPLNRHNEKLHQSLVEDDIATNPSGMLRKIIDLPWEMDSGKGYTDNDFKIYRLEGFEEFYHLLKTVYNDFVRDNQLDSKFKTMDQYYIYRNNVSVINAKNIMEQTTGNIQTAWHHFHFGYSGDSAWAQFIGEFCWDLSESEWQELHDTQVSPQIRIIKAKLFLKQRLDKFGRYDDVLKKFTPTNQHVEHKRIENNKIYFKKMETLFENFIHNNNENALLCEYQHSSELVLPSEASYFAKYKNPYSNFKNKTVSHGTHVSGIIAAQNPKIAIVPIRIITASVEKEKRQTDLKHQFEKRFFAWMKRPLIRDMVYDLTSKVFPSANTTDEDIENTLHEIHRLYYNRLDLDHLFFQEIDEAIKYVGAHKIKLANMSLGTTFERDIIGNFESNNEKEAENLYFFLTYEYFKYHLAQTIKDQAPGTLFVVAAGNDGKWLDGRSRSGLPCDLSSPTLETYYQKAGKLAHLPNYKLTQILCVGSIGKNDDLSPFTNILLTNTPIVFSYGESILSYLKQGDCNGSDKIFNAKNGPFPNYQSSDSNTEADQEFFKQEGVEGETDFSNWHYRQMIYRYNKAMTTKENLLSAITDQKCHQQKYALGEMSGTSMATPAVAGYLARKVIEKMEATNLFPQLIQMGQVTQADNDSIYLDPNFSPESIIRTLIDTSPKYGGNGLLSHICKVIDIRKVDYPNKKLQLALCNSPR